MPLNGQRGMGGKFPNVAVPSSGSGELIGAAAAGVRYPPPLAPQPGANKPGESPNPNGSLGRYRCGQRVAAAPRQASRVRMGASGSPRESSHSSRHICRSSRREICPPPKRLGDAMRYLRAREGLRPVYMLRSHSVPNRRSDVTYALWSCDDRAHVVRCAEASRRAEEYATKNATAAGTCEIVGGCERKKGGAPDEELGNCGRALDEGEMDRLDVILKEDSRNA